ncbi:hypothetical protein IW261DRAFT_1531701 [Armillaria novae-zelandiae]|uniref:Uncharacterized protein n=1 Tax=Armillaria novae-zelandiae TaxID=153914 RepID=A0AA39TWA7_9AGAR|nr:hypothetical protein IW261DRAFT_1531701 [Armillaria novae-zelandiae]
MEKEGMALADRPKSIAAGETLSGGMHVLLTLASEWFKQMRRALHSHLQSKSIASYSPILMKTVRQNMLDIVHDPERCQDHAKWHNIDDETAYLARSMLTVSSDTMASKISVAVMAATCYPETQKKDILPQTMVFMLESFRWRPVMSGGFPHKAMQDIIWVCGTFICSAHKLIIV